MQIPVSLNDLLDVDFHVGLCRRCNAKAVAMLERLNGDLASLDGGIEDMTIFGLVLCIPAEEFADATSVGGGKTVRSTWPDFRCTGADIRALPGTR